MASDKHDGQKNQNGGAAEPPIVEIARYRVQPGSLGEWNAAIKEREANCRRAKGCTDFLIFSPNENSDEKEPPSNAAFRVVLRFDAGKNFTDWEESDARKQSDAQIEPLLQGPVDTQVLTGIETFHTASGQATIVAPPRHKISLLNLLAIFPIALGISYLTTLLLGENLPVAVKTLILTLFLVPLTNYVVMPTMTKIAARWLYPSPK